MPYKKPISKKGIKERKYAHFLKLCWFYLKFDDIYDELTLIKFCKNFTELVIESGIIEKIETDLGLKWEWYTEDGKPLPPDYECINKHCWTTKYEWWKLYPVFKSDMLQAIEDSELEKYIRQTRYFNQQDSKLMRTCYDKEEEYKKQEQFGKDMTYYRNKNNETLSSAENRWRERLGVNKNKVEFNGKVNADVKNTNQNTFDENTLKVISDAITRRNNRISE